MSKHSQVLVLIATALALTACTSTQIAQPHKPTPTIRTTTPQASPTSPCLTDDHNLAPGGYCLYPSSVTWLSPDILPVDPATLDWTDPDAVATAYAITSGTWDTRTDDSGAAASHRAEIFTTAGRTTPDTTDPATAHGQHEFINAVNGDGYSTVDIQAVATEGINPNPSQPDGTWLRVVTYIRTVTNRVDGSTPYQVSGALFLTLAIDPATRQWLITDAQFTPELSTSNG